MEEKVEGSSDRKTLPGYALTLVVSIARYLVWANIGLHQILDVYSSHNLR